MMGIEFDGTKLTLNGDDNSKSQKDPLITIDNNGTLQFTGKNLQLSTQNSRIYSSSTPSYSWTTDGSDDYINGISSGSEDVVFKNPFDFKYENGTMIVARPMGNQFWHTDKPIQMLKPHELKKANLPTTLQPGECGFILGLGEIFDVEIVFFSPNKDGKINNFNTLLKMILKREHEKWMTCFPDYWENNIDNLAKHFKDKTIEKHACKFISQQQ